MSVRLVRCPFCGKRFDLSGFPSGTRLKCDSCTAILAVPRTQRFQERPAAPGLFRRTGAQVAAAVAISLGLAFPLYLLLRPRANSSVAEAPVALRPQPEPKVVQEEPKSSIPNAVYLDFDYRLTQAKLKLRDEFGVDRIRFKDDRKPFLIAMEKSERFSVDSVIREYAERLSELYDFFRQEFKSAIELPEIDDVLPVVVLASRESFDAYTRRVNSGEEYPSQIRGIYEPTRRRVILYHDFVAPFEVILHEGVHQLVHSYMRRFGGNGGASSIQWFYEGLGTYFEGFRRSGDGQIFLAPEVNRSRLPAMKHAIAPQSNTYTPLAALTGMTRDAFWTWHRDQYRIDPELCNRKSQAFYAQSWALVYFFRTQGGAYRRAFDEYFRLELEGQGGKESFEQTIRKHLDLALDELENQFIEYVRKLD